MKKILCVLLLLLTGCSSKTSMIEIQKHVYVEKEFKDSWLETNEFGDSYIKEELQGGYHYHFDQQFLEIFFNTGGKIELYNYSIKKNDLIISGEMIPPKTIRLVHPHLDNVTSEGVIILMKNINLVLLNSLQSYIRNIEHYLIKRQKKNILQNVLKNMLVVIKKR